MPQIFDLDSLKRWQLQLKSIKTWLVLGPWMLGQWIAAKWFGFGTVYLALSIIILIIWNTTTKSFDSKTKSAYSIFNENCERIEGDVDMEALERQIRSGGTRG